MGGFLPGGSLQGIGGSTVIPVSNHLMAHTIAPRRQARALGFFGTGHGLGVVAALLIMPSVNAAGGYRAVFLLTAGLRSRPGAGGRLPEAHTRRGDKRSAEATVPCARRQIGGDQP